MTNFWTAVFALANSPLGWFALLLATIFGIGWMIVMIQRSFTN